MGRKKKKTKTKKSKPSITGLAAIVLASTALATAGFYSIIPQKQHTRPAVKTAPLKKQPEKTIDKYYADNSFKVLDPDTISSFKARGLYPYSLPEKQEHLKAFEIKRLDAKIAKSLQKNKELFIRRGITRIHPRCNATYKTGLVSFLDRPPAAYIASSEKAIKAMREFLKSPHTKTIDYEIIVPTRPEEIKLARPNPSKVKIYLAKYFLVNTSHNLTIAPGLASVVNFENRYAGIIERSYTKQGFTGSSEEQTEGNIFISLDNEPTVGDFGISCFTELLHAMVCPMTQNRTQEKIDKLSYDGLIEKMHNIISEELNKEEVLVHSLAWHFVKKYSAETGLFDFEAESSNLFKNIDEGCYKGMPGMIQRINEIGVQKAIEYYTTDPDFLFRGISLQDYD